MIYAIVGPTSVGKTKLSVMLAKKLNAEIINCDSTQVYKELNIGTAKITEEEKEGIIHHMVDIVSINDDFNAYDYQQRARKILNELIKNNKNVIIVGGTGLYLKVLLYDYNFNNQKGKNTCLYEYKLIGLTKQRSLLYENINKRVDIMLELDLIHEAKKLFDENKDSRVVNAAIGYKELFSYFKGETTLEESVEKIKKASRNYAKRQYTFFNNQFKDIKWYDTEETDFDIIVNEIIKK